VTAPEIAAISTIAMWLVTVLVKYARDKIHKRYTLPVAIVFTVLLLGCGSSGITVYRLVEGEPQPVAEVTQKFAGKGCIAVDSRVDGSASVIVQQAGTSDWSVSRLLAYLGDTAGVVFGGTRGAEEMQGPMAGMQGCEGLFVGEDPLPEKPPIAGGWLVSPME
jgi:hypothetical protein